MSGERAIPLVAAVCRVPLLGEALDGAFDGIAEVRRFPALRGDTVGLLRSLRPDAVVVDCEEEAESAARFARESGVPLVHVSLERGEFRAHEDGVWGDAERDASPQGIRNAVVGGLYAHGRAQ